MSKVRKADPYDVFISYRRSDGFETARLIYDRLSQLGYRVSFDMETLRSGNFNTQLYDRIDNCRDVIVIVSRDALNFREVKEDDWVRLEVSHALKKNKNIIPLFLRGVTPPKASDLPEDVSDLVMKNGVTASDEHFDSSMAKLCRLMTAKPVRPLKRMLPVILLLLTAVVFAGWFFLRAVHPPLESVPAYPATAEEKQDFSLIFNYLVSQAEYVNLLQQHHHSLLKTAERAVVTGNLSAFQDECVFFDEKLHRAKALSFSENLTDLVRRSKVIDAGDFNIFPLMVSAFRDFIRDSPSVVTRALAPAAQFPKNDQLEIIEIQREWGDLLVDNLSLGLMALLRQVSSPEVSDFKKNIGPQLTSLPRLSEQWPTDENVIRTITSRNVERVKELLRRKSAILGNLSQSAAEMERRLRQQMAEKGFSQEQIDHVMAKHRELSRMKAKLETAKRDLAEQHVKLKKKFAPAETDDEGILWSKMLSLKKAGFKDDALKVLVFLRGRKKRTLSDQVCLVAEKVLNSNGPLPFSSGVVIVFFEHAAKKHAIFIPGDVITEVNGKNCNNPSSFKISQGTDYTVFRLKDDGIFEKRHAVMPANQPSCAVAPLPF